MGHLVTVATCALHQHALDFDGNTARIVESIRLAKAKGASIRVGPELEVTGYGCMDHFLEQDLYLHCWQMVERILSDISLHSILIDIGMPVQHRNVRYNCRLICLDGRILLIRPKMWLANDGNYFEMRYFSPWMHPRRTEKYHLPRMIQKLQGETHVLFGEAVISTPDTCIGVETCEELFTPHPPHIDMSLDGVEIISNSSGSHFELRKLSHRLRLIQEGTRKNGGCYLYANQMGCDGDRLFYDGCALVIVNGDVVAQGSQFSLLDVEVVTATVDLEEIRAYRAAASRCFQAAKSNADFIRIEAPFALSTDSDDLNTARRPSPVFEPTVLLPEEEIALAAGCYLWDYLTRSAQAGYLIPLSGGIDSCATAVMVFSMCRLAVDACKAGNQPVIDRIRRLARYSPTLPETPQQLCNQIFHTVYMGMSQQSSKETRQRAKDLAAQIGSHHVDLNIDDIYLAQKTLISQTLGFDPKFRVEGGSWAENQALQNIQARTRMVTAYEFAQLLPTTRQRPGGGSLLVLGSANVGESLRGYLTKYDCSSADINPIGSIDKSDLKRFIRWAQPRFGLPCLDAFLHATPTAELEPITDNYVQSDEADMGLTYDELTTLGRLRKVNKLGPFGVFQRLVHDWSPDRPAAAANGNGTDDIKDSKDGIISDADATTPRMEPRQVAEKVKTFFHYYAINRHKMTTLTPALHCNDYSADDNRFDMRPFVYPGQRDGLAFRMIDEELGRIELGRANRA